MKNRLLRIFAFHIFTLLIFLIPAFSAMPPGIDSLEQLVRDYIRIAQPTMDTSFRLAITVHDVPGLWDSLRIHLFHAEYQSSDGTWFWDGEFLYRNGTIRIFVPDFDGWGLMSGVMRGATLYYTYSWGSGIHRCHIGRLFLNPDTIVIQESGGYAGKDLFVVKTADNLIAIYLYSCWGSRNFNEFDSSAVKWGLIRETESSITVIDTLGKEIPPNFPSKPRAEKANNGRKQTPEKG
jgi:hypothetical protein